VSPSILIEEVISESVIESSCTGRKGLYFKRAALGELPIAIEADLKILKTCDYFHEIEVFFSN